MSRSCYPRLAAFVFVGSVLATAPSFANDDARPEAKATSGKTGQYVYKTEPRRTFTVYYPDDWKPTDKRPALVIFRCRIPEQREHFRKLGMVIIKPQLAPVNSGQLPGLPLAEIATLPKPRHQVQDAKSAIRFVRKNAAKLGVDPQRIVATGTSGGADLALQTHLNTAFEDAQDDKSISPHPDVLVLYCPAFDGIDIWFVKMETLLTRTRAEAPSFVPLLSQFIKNTTDEYATPLDHRVALRQLADTVGKTKGIDASEIESFQAILELFNERDWQLLHPFQDALKMSASRILTKEPFPPTLIMFGERDHLVQHQRAFVETAKQQGKAFDLKIFAGAGHGFMMQPAFSAPSTLVVETFLTKQECLPVATETRP